MVGDHISPNETGDAVVVSNAVSMLDGDEIRTTENTWDSVTAC